MPLKSLRISSSFCILLTCGQPTKPQEKSPILQTSTCKEKKQISTGGKLSKVQSSKDGSCHGAFLGEFLLTAGHCKDLFVNLSKCNKPQFKTVGKLDVEGSESVLVLNPSEKPKERFERIGQIDGKKAIEMVYIKLPDRQVECNLYPDSNPSELLYRCESQPSWSGAPLLNEQGDIVGIHLGRKKNLGRAFNLAANSTYAMEVLAQLSASKGSKP